MLWKDEAVLIQQTERQNSNGYVVKEEARREVFVDRQSARRSEFYAAKQVGEEIALVLLVRGVDYEGERLVEFEGRRYRVVRDYTKGGEVVELNCASLPEEESS